jgi:hypothetical protein
MLQHERTAPQRGEWSLIKLGPTTEKTASLSVACSAQTSRHRCGSYTSNIKKKQIRRRRLGWSTVEQNTFLLARQRCLYMHRSRNFRHHSDLASLAAMWQVMLRSSLFGYHSWLTLRKALPWEPLVGGGGLGPRVFLYACYFKNAR